MMVSLFPYIKQTTGGAIEALSEILAGIQDGRWANAVALVRATTSDEARTEAKKHVPYFTVSGVFPRRNDASITQHSGFIALDVDRKGNPGVDLPAARALVEADPFTYACFASISSGPRWGDNFCVIVRVPADSATHRAIYASLKAYYREAFGLTLDACPDLSRARFVSYDDALYFNEDAQAWSAAAPDPEPKPAPAPQLTTTWQPSRNGQGYGQTALQNAVAKILNAPDGTKHATLNKMAFLCGGYVASGFLREEEARQALQQAISARALADPKQAFRTIDDGLRDGQKKPILPEQLQYAVRQARRDNGRQGDVTAKLSATQGVPAERLAPAVRAIYEEPDLALETFWTVLVKEGTKGHPDTVRVVIADTKYTDWLAAGGFAQVLVGRKQQLVRVADHVVTPVTESDIKHHVLTYLDTLPFEFDGIFRVQLEDLVRQQHKKLFDDGYLAFLPALAPEAFVRDTASEARFFFANGWVAVTAAGMDLCPYAQLPGYVWAEQVRPRPFEVPFTAEASGDFARFVYLLAGEDMARYTTLCRALGYYLHGYKDPTVPKAVVLCDETTGRNGEPNGRTGKSLLVQALGQLVPIVTIDGKGYDERDRAAFQLVTAATRIVFFDDLEGRKHRFERFFNLISGDFVVTRLYSGQEVIPRSRSPKLVFAMNDTFASTGESHTHRKLEIEIAPRYSASYEPRQDFEGRRFFDDWAADEWLAFDAFLLDCCRAYLAHGLPTAPPINLARRKVMQVTGGGDAFLTFMDEQTRGQRLYLVDLRRTYLEVEGITDRDLSAQLFGRWVQAWATHGGIDLIEGREKMVPDRGKRYVIIPEE